MKGDGSHLDIHLLAAIRAGIRRLEDLTLAVCRQLPPEQSWRAVSARLDAMRKRGLVDYKPGKGWAEERT